MNPANLPDRSLQQRLDALEKANTVRTARAKLKADLKAGRLTVHDVLANVPTTVQTMKAFDLLRAVPKYGSVKVNKVLTQCRISPSKTIGGLSDRQRDELVLLLRRGPQPPPPRERPPTTRARAVRPVHYRARMISETTAVFRSSCDKVVTGEVSTFAKSHVTCRNCLSVIESVAAEVRSRRLPDERMAGAR